ncbi:lysine 2,3-aminomutase related protein enzyme [Melioribacter roseus P3M-2]|uniref:Lysine 2,3-aminomutase related protein enzyme n=1 Tax=Melioribacter roseus (strain DSM 23840 / JCM 17771 / VKM B-2668 / P3M-2) TaxID=1191523 RepID=I6ZYN4_MELRP|nr:lysine 2,3-aminomutase [Melioribacter roseus]AFN74133.1 lysine 2,3-aminomutase related protein enzyme [Melioribacter roseus P3M-2]
MRNYKSFTLRNWKELPQLQKLSDYEKKAIEVVGTVLPFKTNNYVVEELIDWNNIPDDPIFTLTFPRAEMLRQEHYKEVEKLLDSNAPQEEIKETVKNIRWELNPHPAGQKYNVPKIDGIELTGVQHKYRETVLFFPSQGQTCHAYCTFCFRWPQFVGMNELKFAMKETELLIRYLKEHTEVTDLLFTGGDPLIMKTKILASYIDQILDADIENLQTIRIGTKAIGYWPYRFIDDPDADDLIRLFEKIISKGKNLAIMAHFNHPVELSTPAAEEAIRRIRATGAQIRTQSPLLRHINDSSEVWAEMWRKQVNLNCIPYYMFVARDTGAQEFFGVPLVEAWNIYRNAYKNVSGVCRTVRGPSMSATPGKVQILGVSEVNGEKTIVLRFLQGRDPDWVARPFFAKYDEKAIWLDQLKPAFGGDKFFFEDELESIFHEHIYDDESENFE